MNNFKLLFTLFYRPVSAMSDVVDRGSWFFAAGLVLLVAAAFFATINPELQATYAAPDFYQYYKTELAAEMSIEEAKVYYSQAQAEFQKVVEGRQTIPLAGDHFFRFFSFEAGGFWQPLFAISVFYVPVVILLMCVFGGAGSFGTVLPREYGAIATTSLMAWGAAHLPFAAAGFLIDPSVVSPLVLLGMWAAGSLLFGMFMVFALRNVFGATYTTAVLVVSAAWLGISLAVNVFQLVSPLMFLPFLLFYVFSYFAERVGSEIKGYGHAFRQKQKFKRYLLESTRNPYDASAHVQLGLIYRQRRQDAKALVHLRRAVEIDRNEVEANYELGKIARAKGDLQKAINHFAVVVEQDDKHALSEVWRHIGAAYLEAGMIAEAREALETFNERRPFDVEGLYYLGKVLKAQNEHEKARKVFRQAVESVHSSPIYRHREVRYWSKLAQKEI